jgi:predicted secreted protein
MKWQSALAIYTLFWVMSAFIVMPFGVRTHDEAGLEKVPGQADSAPANFRPGRILFGTTIVATVFFGLFLLNWTYGWVTPQSLDVFTPERFRNMN